MPEDHLFTDKSSPRLTFLVGIAMGVTIMTIGGLFFFIFVLSGGNVGTYEIAPLEPSSNILEEPVGELEVPEGVTIAETDAAHTLGAQENYTVTLVQYVDYECKFCKKFFPEVTRFVEDNADSVRLLVKHYPLTRIHPHAKQAAVAAECAAQQDKFFEYSAQLYEQQDQLASNETYTNALAEELELDMAAFESCLIDDATIERIETDTQEARSLGVKSQPNLLIWHTGESNEDTIELIDGYVNQSYIESILASDIQ